MTEDISHLTIDGDLVMVYMPNLNYKKLEFVNEYASMHNMYHLTIPITLPVMDIVKQMEYAGISVSQELATDIIPGEVRKAIINSLKEGMGEWRIDRNGKVSILRRADEVHS